MKYIVFFILILLTGFLLPLKFEFFIVGTVDDLSTIKSLNNGYYKFLQNNQFLSKYVDYIVIGHAILLITTFFYIVKENNKRQDVL